MFLGHFGVALAAKKAAPRVSLGWLVVGTQLADLLWPIFLILGWETVRIAPGITRVTPLDFTWYPFSHGLVADVAWGALLGAGYFAWHRDRLGALVLAACVPSHWLLDYVVHRPDLPLYPGSALHGLCLWNSLTSTLVVELGLFVAGLAIYLRATRAWGAGRPVLWAWSGFLVLAYAASVFGPPPPNVRTLAYSALAVWLLPLWAAWADRRRPKIAGANGPAV